MITMQKYPRTRHLQGSRLQPGDEDLSQVDYNELAGKYIVIEEKIDGAQAGISFDTETLALLLQSRGHYLTGGGREKHFTLLKQWANYHENSLFALLGDQYIAYGEWMFAKHTVFYDALPHLWFEFDIWDRNTQQFFSTEKRHALIKASGAPIVSVPVLYAGVAPKTQEEFLSYLTASLGKTSAWKQALQQESERAGVDFDRACQETDMLDLMEGLYIKVEEGDYTVDRLKWVRNGFNQIIQSNDSHWLTRPIIRNGLMEGADLYAPTVKDWPQCSPCLL